MNQLDLIYGPDSVLSKTYGKEPFRSLFDDFLVLFTEEFFDSNSKQILMNKLLNACRKLYMLHAAGTSALAFERSFMITQNREIPTLIWDDEIKLLYHLEAMILFARSALDIGANIFSYLLIEPYGQRRRDSFNDFSKDLLKGTDEKVTDLRTKISELEKRDISWYRLLCGSTKGRALRDKIAHQTIINIDYLEIEGGGDKEYCHIIVDNIPIPLELFVANITLGVFDFFLNAEETILKIWKS